MLVVVKVAVNKWFPFLPYAGETLTRSYRIAEDYQGRSEEREGLFRVRGIVELEAVA